VALQQRYKTEHKQMVIDALQAMLDRLQQKLRIYDFVSMHLDTPEEHRDILDTLGIHGSPEELAESLNASRDRSISDLGHIQKRIDEVRCLKEAFEAGTPSPSNINRAYAAIRSSQLYESMELAVCCPLKQIVAAGVADLSDEKKAEVQLISKMLRVYSDALMFGFNLSPMFWSEFPFDTT